MKTHMYRWGILLFLLGIVPSFATAQNAELDPAVFFPADIDIMYSLKTTTPNPFEDSLIESIKNWSSKVEESKDQTVIIERISELLKNSEVYFGMKMDSIMNEADMSSHEPEIFVASKMSMEDFETFRKHYAPDAKTETYRDLTMYSKNDGYAVLTNGWVLMSNNDANLKKMIDAAKDNTNNVANLESYKKVKANELSQSFLTMYIDPAFVVQMNEKSSEEMPTFIMGGFEELFKNDIYKLIKAEGVSVAYNNNGFDFSMTIEGNKEELQKTGMEFNKYNFVPSLYKYISGNNLIMYNEQNNTKQQMEDTFKMLDTSSYLFTNMTSRFNTWKTTFESETGINIQDDALSLLTGRELVAVHNSNQIYPAATMIFEVNNTQKAGTSLQKFADYLKKYFDQTEKDMGKEFVTYNTPSINGTAYYEFKLDMKPLMGDSDFNNLPAEATDLYIRMAVTTDGLLVISNHPDLGSVFKKESLLADQTAAQKLGNMNEEIESVFYMNFVPLHDYVKNFMEKADAPDTAQQEVNNFMKLFGTISGKSYSNSAESMLVKGRFEVDASGLGAAFTELVKNFGGMYDYERFDEMPVSATATQKVFCDVTYTDKDYFSINFLKVNGIITGYPDGCFYPDKSINRAEFITMLMRAIESNDKVLQNGSSNQVFSDVKIGTWHFPHINKAAANKLVNGFGDGTFHPEETITRAQALQMLYNSSSSLQHYVPYSNEIDYADVKTTDWYYKALAASYNEGYLAEALWGNGTNFEPHKNITRREAARLLTVFTSLEGNENDSLMGIESAYATPATEQP